MGDVFPQSWCGEKGKFFALLRAASLPLPIYGGARSAKCQEWASAMPGIPHPIPTFPQFFPFYPQIGGLYSLTLLPLDRLENRPTFIHYPLSPPPSVLCPDSFIRSPFVDGLPPQTGKPALLSFALLGQPSARRLSPSVPRCPRSTIHRPPCRPCSAPIRLFVPHSLTVSLHRLKSLSCCRPLFSVSRLLAVCRPAVRALPRFVYSFPIR
jgi:hypothetical protein